MKRSLFTHPNSHFAILLFAMSLWLLSGCTASNLARPQQNPLPTARLSTLPPTSWPIVTATFTSSVTIPAPTQTPAPSLTPTPTYPKEHYIRDINGHKQYFKLGCETSAAVDLAFYYGVTINEFEFQHRLPLSDNPDLGFVGSVDGPWGQVPPYAYGVHAGPVAALLQEYGLQAKGLKGFTLDEIKSEISQGHPVIVWVVGNMVGGVPYDYTDQKGNKVMVAAYEHVVIMTGYNETHMRYMNNGNFFEVPTDLFSNSWQILGNMALVIDPD